MARATKTAPKAQGGKPGSTRSNQTAKYGKGELHPAIKSVTSDQHATKPVSSRAKQADSMTAAKTKAAPTTADVTVREVRSANNGHVTIAVLSNGKVEPIDSIQKAGVTVLVGQKWSDVVASHAAKKAAAKEGRGPGHLANGVNGTNAPHSAKAVADGRRSVKGASKAAAPKAEKASLKAKAERAAKRAEKAAPKADDARKITILQKSFTFGREGTVRHDSWLACAKAKTVAEYLAAGGKAKYLPRWAAAGAIKLG